MHRALLAAPVAAEKIKPNTLDMYLKTTSAQSACVGVYEPVWLCEGVGVGMGVCRTCVLLLTGCVHVCLCASGCVV